MTGLISFLIFVAVVVLVAVIVYWALSKLLSQVPGMPGGVIVVLQVIIVLVALLVILQRAWPFVSGYA